MAVRCALCRARTPFPQLWDSEQVCLPCFFAESRYADRLGLDAAIDKVRELGACAYCGEPASELEHVVPRCAGLPTWTVPACSDCNNLAAGGVFESFRAKRDFIREAIRRRHAKVLRTPEWDEDELAELGPALRASTAAYTAARAVVLSRLNFALEFI